MVLSAAVILGLTAGLARAWYGKRHYRVPDLRLPGLVFSAFLIQWLVFNHTRIGPEVPESWAPVLLVVTQAALLVFAWANRKQPGFWFLGAGLFLNLLVISLNGGLMPITPERVRQVYPDAPDTAWQLGERLGSGKDIVLLREATRLWFLSDQFFYSPFPALRIAFSLGDVLIAVGAIWLLWSLGGLSPEQAKTLS